MPLFCIKPGSLKQDVAFYAEGTGDHSHPAIIQPGQTIIFPYTLTNVGKAYDQSTGYFTAPFNGVYQVHCITFTSV